jgi:hypothetical protein
MTLAGVRPTWTSLPIGDVHRDVAAAGQADEQVDVVWVAGDDGHRAFMAQFLGYRHDLRIGGGDLSTQPGDVVDFELRDEEIVLVARRSPARLGGRFSKTGMAARLLEDRVIEPR